MDQDNFHGLMSICPVGMEDKIHLLMDYAPAFRTREVPDPYYGGDAGFEESIRYGGSSGIRTALDELKRRHVII